MKIDDQYIKDKFFSKNGKVIKSRINNMTTEENNYIVRRYEDSLSFDESIHRIYYNIENVPLCPICGKLRKYYKGSKFHSTCLNELCIKELNSKHGKETCIRKYGVDNYAKTEINKKESVERYWKLHDQITEKRRLTNLERYGVENCFQSEDKKEKIRQTCLYKYGYDYAAKVPSIIDKITKKQNELYGHRFNPEKYKETCLKIYGVDNAAKNKDIQNKITDTQIKKYGNRFNPLKTAEKIINEYDNNYDIHSSSLHELHRKNMHTMMSSEKMKIKLCNIKRNNVTFNSSKPEDMSYKLLLEKYPDTLRQYRCDRYPFNCDFYIPSEDIFIECQYGWVHGEHVFDTNNNNDLLILEKWKSKHTKYYDNAIKTWTITDPNKRKIAKENNLNYLEFWNINELKTWLNITI